MKNFILLVMAIATSTVVGAQAPNYIPSEGLAGWWPLDGNALDGGSFENHGTVSGAVGTTNRYNEASGAMAFDGIDDHIVVPDAPSLQITGNLTISLWYTTPGPTGNYQSFLDTSICSCFCYGIRPGLCCGCTWSWFVNFIVLGCALTL